MATINGGVRSDKLTGTKDNDQIFGGRGDDQIDGGGGTDSAVFTGRFQDYRIKQTPSTNTNLSISGPDGDDSVKNVELLLFDDGMYDAHTRAFTSNIVAISNASSVVE